MLHLKRKVRQRIIINGDIELEVVEIKPRSVILGFKFPDGNTVYREEVENRIRQEQEIKKVFKRG